MKQVNSPIVIHSTKGRLNSYSIKFFKTLTKLCCLRKKSKDGAEGKSKYKEFEKSFQDALRKAFNGFDALKVQQQKVVLLADNTSAVSVNPNRESSKMEQSAQREITNVSGNMLPTAKYSNYTNAGKSYMLRNTAEGFSLYEETNTAPDGLLLKGKIIVMDALVKYMDSAGKIYDATFDASGNLTIGGPDGNPQLYILKN